MADLTDEKLAQMIESSKSQPEGMWYVSRILPILEELQRRRAADAKPALILPEETPEPPDPVYSIDMPDLVKQSREVTYHRCAGNVLNDAIRIVPIGNPTAGGACATYDVIIGEKISTLRFQVGDPRKEIDADVSNEALLAIVQHRLEGFQSGPFACQENGSALSHVRSALDFIHHRTQERAARGVEGKAVV